jgi:PAS fold.
LSLLGLDSLPEAPVIQSLESYFQPEDYAELLKELKEDGEIQEREVQLRQADGSVIWVRLSTTLITIEGQTIVTD